VHRCSRRVGIWERRSWRGSYAASCKGHQPERHPTGNPGERFNAGVPAHHRNLHGHVHGSWPTGSGKATVTVTTAPPIVLIGASAGAPADVIGGITLRRTSGRQRIVYSFDARRWGQPRQTDFFRAGRHWAEADITRVTARSRSAGGR